MKRDTGVATRGATFFTISSCVQTPQYQASILFDTPHGLWSAPRLLVHPKCYSAWVDRSGFGGCPCKPRSHSALKSLGVLYLRELWGRMRLYSRLHQRALLRASATDSNSSQFKNSSRSRLWKDSMKPFSQGLAGATGIAFVPVCGNQAVKIAQINSEPLSLRIRVGPPRRPITRAARVAPRRRSSQRPRATPGTPEYI